jgi:hypothetical protein
MTDGSEKRLEELEELLKKSQMMMVDLSARCASTQGDWDKAKALLDGARQIDGILEILVGRQTSIANTARSTMKLPYYYVERDKLVKTGRSRAGGTYEHRVIKEHYDLIVGRLIELEKRGGTFDTRKLVEQCDVPAHEPLIVVNVLNEQGLLGGLRRGRWEFTNRFAEVIHEVWGKLPRR